MWQYNLPHHQIIHLTPNTRPIPGTVKPIDAHPRNCQANRCTSQELSSQKMHTPGTVKPIDAHFIIYTLTIIVSASFEIIKKNCFGAVSVMDTYTGLLTLTSLALILIII